MNIFVRSHCRRWRAIRSPPSGCAGSGKSAAARKSPPPRRAAARPSRPSLRRRGRSQAAKRRRTAAEVAQVEAQVQAEKAAELAALELERPVILEPEERPDPNPRGTRPRPVQGSAARAARGRGERGRDRRGAGQRRRPGGGRRPRRHPSARRSRPGRRSSRRGVQRPAPPPLRGPKPVFSSSAPPASVPARRPRAARRGRHVPAAIGRAGSHLRARCREGWRAEEGQERQALVGGSGSGAGQHPADPPGHEGSGRPEGPRAPTSRRSVRCRPAGWPRRRSGRRP